MRTDYLYTVILGAVVTEKSTMVREKYNQYVFDILPRANKDDVKDAVELIFKVNVTGVNIVNTKGKKKRHGRYFGKRKDVKKAYVSLAEGQAINFAQEVK
ncbi:MAG: 50S ribosomal protein L23 [Burkholderiales bacterium]|nr:50S ribosomal protein L23 [Burkholderiales bacterium]